MTVIDRNNKQNQFYRKQARLSMKVFKFREFVTKINREKESLTYVTTQFRELEGENIASLVSLDHMRELRVAHF